MRSEVSPAMLRASVPVMKSGPDITRIARLIGDPARANILTALMGGQALTASELARQAGVTAATASSHLSQLVDGGLLVPEKQGRHRYFQLAGHEVAELLEDMSGLAERVGHLRFQPGPRDPQMRRARVCYDHLAGEMGVALHDALCRAGAFAAVPEGLSLSPAGRDLFGGLGIDADALGRQRRSACRTCLDWSERRHHLAGAAGAALLARLQSAGWLARVEGSRAIRVTQTGEARWSAFLAGIASGEAAALD